MSSLLVCVWKCYVIIRKLPFSIPLVVHVMVFRKRFLWYAETFETGLWFPDINLFLSLWGILMEIFVLENDCSALKKLYVDVVFWAIRFSSFAQVRSIWETLNISYLHMHRCRVLIISIHDFTETLLFMHLPQEAEKKIQLQAVSPHLLNNLSRLHHQKWQVFHW